MDDNNNHAHTSPAPRSAKNSTQLPHIFPYYPLSGTGRVMAATGGRSRSQGGRETSSSGSLEVIENPRTTTVSVDDSETWVEAKRYTVYKIVVKIQGRAYFLFRR